MEKNVYLPILKDWFCPFAVRVWLLIVTSPIDSQVLHRCLFLHSFFLRIILKTNPYPKHTTTTHKISPGMNPALP